MATDTVRTQRRNVRDEATIGHLVKGMYQPKDADQKQTVRSPTTSTGLSIEDQVRKEWDPSKMGGLPTY
jgi:hypothetical protein